MNPTKTLRLPEIGRNYGNLIEVLKIQHPHPELGPSDWREVWFQHPDTQTVTVVRMSPGVPSCCETAEITEIETMARLVPSST